MTSKVFDILVAGEINPDLVLRGNVIPEFGQVEKVVEAADLTVGSSSAIFACSIAICIYCWSVVRFILSGF